MNTDPGEFLDAVGAALSTDGRVAELQFLRKNKKAAYIQFPTEAASSILLNIEQALGKLFRMQREMLKGADPRHFFAIGAKHVVKIQGAVAQGSPVVSFLLKSDVRMDFRFDQTAIRELIEWLQGLETEAQKPPARGN
jgi:hypothetical protein